MPLKLKLYRFSGASGFPAAPVSGPISPILIAPSAIAKVAVIVIAAATAAASNFFMSIPPIQD